jgi:hypothetical protein
MYLFLCVVCGFCVYGFWVYVDSVWQAQTNINNDDDIWNYEEKIEKKE